MSVTLIPSNISFLFFFFKLHTHPVRLAPTTLPSIAHLIIREVEIPFMQPWTEEQNQPNLKITGLVQFSLNFCHIRVVVVFFFFFFQRWVVATTVVVVVNMASCYEFLWDKFYFILISCLYCFNGMNVKIEPLMLDVL